MSKMTKEEAKRRAELIIKNSPAKENARVVMSDWRKHGYDRTYIKIYYDRDKVKNYGYIDNETGEYFPRKYEDLRKNHDIGGSYVFEDPTEASEECVETGDVVEIVNGSDRNCLVCGSDVKIHDLKLNRKNGTNIIRFAVCSACLNEIAGELKKQIEEEQ